MTLPSVGGCGGHREKSFSLLPVVLGTARRRRGGAAGGYRRTTLGIST